MTMSLNRRRKRRKLAAYALATGTALVAADRSRADIIYSGPQDILIDTIHSSSGYNLNVNNDGGPTGDSINDFVIKDTGQGIGGLFDKLTVKSFGSNAVVKSSSGFAAALSSGTWISASSSFSTGTLTMAQRKPDQGQWLGVQHRYLGLQFDIPGSGTHYGWAELTVDELASNRISTHLLGWAYETDTGVGIGAGVTTPEPSSMVIALCGLGAAGIAALRRLKPA
jgi:hypothetical protein